MDSFEPRMNPRFLVESEKGMLREPRVIESGRAKVDGFKEDEKGKRRASILLSFITPSIAWRRDSVWRWCHIGQHRCGDGATLANTGVVMVPL